ncbi:zinc-ribbon domain-containing protein [Streptomyces sp. Ag82_O1-15]|uniref:zinc-ribbon domain-containing protein n=1 Tax=Streptomyces sp. Ag82_O1-15 TaxID=1938855 RepID=UPI00359C19DB
MLRDTHPAVFAEISVVEPASVDRDALTTSSGRTVLWTCGTCGHQWRGRVVDRTKAGGRGCSQCRRTASQGAWQTPPPGASLQERSPEIAAELTAVDGHPGRTASDIHASSNKMCQWRCGQCGNQWSTTPNARSRTGSGCPQCRRVAWRTPPPGASLQERSPEIAAELTAVDGHPGRTASDIHASSNKMCQWRCGQCGNQWSTTPNARSRTGAGSGCPKCGRLRTINARRIARPGASLADLYPELALEFVANLENELTALQLKPHSNYKCQWRCRSCNNEWVAVPQNRVSGKTGCPACFAARRGNWRRSPKSTSLTAHDVLGEVASDFVSNETTPDHDLTMLRPGSADKCTWLCSTCGHTWIASVASRVASHRNRSGSGCRKCYDRRIATRRRTPKEGESLKERYPQISQSFVENLTTPGAGPERLRIRSNDRCLWRCNHGHEWEANVLSRTYGSGCPKCTSAGRSRFELEVQSLLIAATGTDVVCDYAVEHVLGLSGRRPRVDLFIPAVQLYVDLDPFRTHSTDRHREKDARKSTLLCDLDYVRVRARGLPAIPGEHVEVIDSTKDGINPWTWASSLRPILLARGLPFDPLNREQRGIALGRAAEAWATVKGRVRFESVAERNPELLIEFRKNLTRPEYDLSLCSPSSFDVAEWQCAKCGLSWETMIRNRAISGSGCHSCHRQGINNNNVARSIAQPGESLAELFPDIAARFIRCLKDPSRTPDNLRIKSNLKCEWSCHTGEHTFTAPVFSVSSGTKRRCCK